MPSRSSKKPKRDFAQVAFDVVSQLTGGKKEAQPEDLSKALDDEALRKQIMQEMGRRGGQKGGNARAEKLTQEQRRDIALKAARKRWSKG